MLNYVVLSGSWLEEKSLAKVNDWRKER